MNINMLFVLPVLQGAAHDSKWFEGNFLDSAFMTFPFLDHTTYHTIYKRQSEVIILFFFQFSRIISPVWGAWRKGWPGRG